MKTIVSLSVVAILLAGCVTPTKPDDECTYWDALNGALISGCSAKAIGPKQREIRDSVIAASGPFKQPVEMFMYGTPHVGAAKALESTMINAGIIP